MGRIIIAVCIILCCLFCESTQDKSSEEEDKNILKLVIDNDAGSDDAMAIFLTILASKHLNNAQLIGLTTTHGNVDEDKVVYNNQRILKVAESDEISIYRGANYSFTHTPAPTEYFGSDGLGDTDYKPEDLKPWNNASAVETLIKLSKEHENQLVVVSIGSLTNIALAVALDQGFLGRLKQLYIGAGHIYGENNTDAEFNAFTDPESYFKVVNNSLADKVTVFPFSQVLSFLKVPLSWRQNTLGAIESDIMKKQNSFERISQQNFDYWADLDPAVLAVVLKGDLVEEYKYSRNNIILCGEQRGITTNEFVVKEQANVRLVYKVNVEAYKQFLMDVFSAGHV